MLLFKLPRLLRAWVRFLKKNIHSKYRSIVKRDAVTILDVQPEHNFIGEAHGSIEVMRFDPYQGYEAELQAYAPELFHVHGLSQYFFRVDRPELMFNPTPHVLASLKKQFTARGIHVTELRSLSKSGLCIVFYLK